MCLLHGKIVTIDLFSGPKDARVGFEDNFGDTTHPPCTTSLATATVSFCSTIGDTEANKTSSRYWIMEGEIAGK